MSGFHGRIEADRARDGRLLAVAADERDETGRCPERMQELGDRNLDTSTTDIARDSAPVSVCSSFVQCEIRSASSRRLRSRAPRR